MEVNGVGNGVNGWSVGSSVKVNSVASDPEKAKARQDWKLSPPVVISYGVYAAQFVLADMDNNGMMDVVTLTTSPADPSRIDPVNSSVKIAYRDKNGTLSPPVQVAKFNGLASYLDSGYSNLSEKQLEVADLDGDGTPDISVGLFKGTQYVHCSIYLPK